MIDVKKRTIDSVTVLDLFGTLDLDGCNLLKEKLQELRQSGEQKIVLNCEKLESLQNTVLPNLVTPVRALVVTGGKIAFCGMNGSVAKAIQSSMLDPIIQTAPSVEEGVALIEEEA